MNKKTTITTALLTLVIAGCGTTTTYTQEEQKYLTAVHYDEVVEVEMRTDDELITLGRYTCELFYDGVTPSEVIVEVVEVGNLQTGEAIDAIITNALLGFCPEHADVLNYG